ncbi:type II toxin-antitoxin system death-on-curing family toxin [Aneurinibacillus aneurinilyticus]|uniref:type II toxin-antitoxin system death-on-curing family toxin n=1 Tax=Aneurinibacillus aneurinilyticus TaxID=1391 RepID=UPI002E24CFD3|nr:type II toxin-antitoxin system death-on-curing family toxin [Aneurinibacillus aneurinilyticus]
MNNIIYLTTQEVIEINRIIILKYSPQEMIGVKYWDRLESAIERPKQTVFGLDAYPDIFSKGAALFESIAKDHVFQNANKRTGFACLFQFLMYNGYELNMEQKYAEDFTVDVVLGEYSFEDFIQIIKNNCNKL